MSGRSGGVLVFFFIIGALRACFSSDSDYNEEDYDYEDGLMVAEMHRSSSACMRYCVLSFLVLSRHMDMDRPSTYG